MSLIIFIVAILIYFIPVKVAKSRGLSGGQIVGVFLATVFGFWILGMILALILSKSS